MKGMLPAMAIGSLLALLAIGAVLALRPTPDPAPAERAETLARELRCPDCQGLSVADSPTRSAQEIRRQIDELVAAGATNDGVRAHFVARYGEWILLAPSAPLAWLAPFAVVLAAAAGLVAWLVRRDAAPPVPATVLGDDERRRLHEEAEALDA